MRTRLAYLSLSIVLTGLTSVRAQTVQLPTYRVYSTNSTVSVPDGGAAMLSGNTISRSGANSNGIPILGRLPGVGRGFRNRAFGADNTANRSWVTAQIIDHREWDAAVLAEARRRRGEPSRQELEAAELEQQAAFLTQHVGRQNRNRALTESDHRSPARLAGRNNEPPLRLGNSIHNPSQTPPR